MTAQTVSHPLAGGGTHAVGVLSEPEDSNVVMVIACGRNASSTVVDVVERPCGQRAGTGLFVLAGQDGDGSGS